MKTMTRRQVIRALRTEKLAGGYFVDHYIWNDKKFTSFPSESKDCTVCAVGALLRYCGMSNSKISDWTDKFGDFGAFDPTYIGASTQELLDNKQYLHALSFEFETVVEKLGKGKRMREHMVKFVKNNFPKTIKIDKRY